jgi:hypothetical protein
MDPRPKADPIAVRAIRRAAGVIFVCIGVVVCVLQTWDNLSVASRSLVLGACLLAVMGAAVVFKHAVGSNVVPLAADSRVPSGPSPSIRITGVRNPDALEHWFDDCLQDIAYVVATSQDAADLAVDESFDMQKRDDREFVTKQVEEALAGCREDQARIEVLSRNLRNGGQA